MDLELLDGYRRFRAGRMLEQAARYDAVKDAQPEGLALVIACADSRVSPSLVFDASPGEIFTVRNVANLVPPYEPGAGLHGTSATIEFAVKVLKVRSITVMGHGGCGGCAASLAGVSEGDFDFLSDWVALLAPARERALACADADCDPQRALELEGVRASLANLMTFPFIADRVRSGETTLHGVWFSIGEARLEALDLATGAFRPIS